MKKLITIGIVVILMFLLVGCAKEPEEGAAPPLIYVNDSIYIERDLVKKYSPEWTCLGEIKNKVSDGERLPEENFTANTWPVGTKVYLDEKERVWIQITQGYHEGKYIGYEILIE